MFIQTHTHVVRFFATQECDLRKASKPSNKTYYISYYYDHDDQHRNAIPSIYTKHCNEHTTKLMYNGMDLIRKWDDQHNNSAIYNRP